SISVPCPPPEIPQITISTEAIAPDRIRICIRDNGPGMSETVRQRVFDPFFTTKEVGGGTGLGMSISHQIIVERHQGQIQCHSVPCEGTEFRIELPVTGNRKRPPVLPSPVAATTENG
ncbi:MAG TPA: HAMP domain-containing sensor histidine kinase, partial [Chroococcidiopsis sp.]